MKIIHLRQHWKGFFTYLEGYETLDQYREVEFEMEITLTENSFVGIATDSESKDAFQEPAKVKGFIDNEKISFVMKYPCAYFKDERGKIILDKSSQHPEIHYLGFIDDDNVSVSGHWEMTIYQEEHSNGYLEETLSGEFRMRKIN